MNKLFDFTLPDDYGEPPEILRLDGVFGSRDYDDNPPSGSMDACAECHHLFKEDNLTATYDGFLVCAECLEAGFIKCDSCSSVVDKDDVEEGICPVCGNDTGGE